jgi:ABC-2 type transport system permease protein
MAALVGSGMAKFAAYQASGFSIDKLMAQFPKTLQTIFGLSGFDLTKASGFYGVMFLYIVLMATIHAVLMGADLISKEERDRTSEFLLVKPISRANIISAKLLAGVVNIVILNLVTLLSSIYFVHYFGKGVDINKDILVLMGGLLLLQLLFFFVGLAIAAANKKPKTSASLASSVLLFTFILAFLINFNSRLDSLKYFTPFKYFEAKPLLTSGSLDPVYVVLSLAIIAILTFITYSTYTKRDLSV